MSNVSENLRDLSESGSEALQALLNSIVPGGVPGAGSTDDIKRLTEKLGELVGENAMKDFDQRRNERGELVNEEGLPIIEISELITNSIERRTGNSLLAEEERLVPIESLSSSAREEWKRERDRILDLLEKEERADQMQENQDDFETREVILQKRREAAAKEREKMKAAKEMQKKMGKALLGGGTKTKSKEDRTRPTSNPIEDDRKQAKSPKKTVSFAVEGADEDGLSGSSNISRPVLDWGDVTLGRLKSTSNKPLLRTSETLPMKMNVVERQPKNQLKINTSISADSDDESDLEDGGSSDSTSALQPDNDQDSIHSPVETESEGELYLEEEFDLDYAQHQREIALEYHKKRSKFNREALEALTLHSHNVDVHDTSLDMPSSEHHKPSISQFRASRLASSYGASSPFPSSIPPEASILPPSSARTIQKAIRTGKLDADGHLVGGEFDSASEDEADGMQDILELLRKGEVYNFGPDANYVHIVPPQNVGEEETTTIPANREGTSSETIPLPALTKPKTSKFKLDRSQAGRPNLHVPQTSSASSRSEIALSNIQKPSPKIPISSVMERRPPTKATPPKGPSSSQQPPTLLSNTPVVVHRGAEGKALRTSPPVMPSMIVESPSFAKPTSTTSSLVTKSSPLAKHNPSMPPMVVESPSFARPTNPPTIISSPSFPPPANQRLSRPPVVLSSSVLETNKLPTQKPEASPATQPGKKISRFMADRM